MIATPSVSILLPVRDGERTLPAALRSLRLQTWADFECVVVDDGSSDASFEVAARVASEDPRFRCFRQEPLGIVPALIRAAAEARAPLLARQDADDESCPGRLAAQIEHLRARPGVGLVSSLVEHSGLPQTDGGARYAAWLDRCRTAREIANGLWVESPVPHPTVVLRREWYDRAGGYRDRGWPEDYDLWLRLRRLGVRMEKLDQRLYRWTDRADRASRRLPEYGTDRFLACRVHHLCRYLEGRAAVVWGAGRDGRRFARAFLAEGGKVLLFLDIDPRKIGRRAYGHPIVDAHAWLAANAVPPGSRSAAAPSTSGESDPADEETVPILRDEGPIVLAAVGTRGAREIIRAALAARGLHEGIDFLCVA